jgi:hypothetical protein
MVHKKRGLIYFVNQNKNDPNMCRILYSEMGKTTVKMDPLPITESTQMRPW